ncbi:MAG: ParB N-terminal domain-containing protein [Deltaproteobacteria bacterium]|nr:ParB N-terminal domain-containing protein [Deltaproteobacteria bacterium]
MDQQNEQLHTLSKTLFGESAYLEVVAPKSLTLLKENARYFKKETFQALVENIKNDKRLSSMPLCCIEEKKYVVLSGNHRVRAAIEAGIEQILVMVIAENLTKNEKIAIQLSHNALVGVDDVNILKSLWEQIDSIQDKIYSGLSSETIKEIENIKPVNFSTPPVYTKALVFAFTETEKEFIDHILAELKTAAQSGDLVLAPMEMYREFFDTIQETKKLHEIKNGSLALLKLFEIAAEHMGGE